MSEKIHQLGHLMALADSMTSLFNSSDVTAITMDVGLDAEIEALRQLLGDLQVKVHAIYCAEHGVVH